jgi:hypothetical protein
MCNTSGRQKLASDFIIFLSVNLAYLLLQYFNLAPYKHLSRHVRLVYCLREYAVHVYNTRKASVTLT